MLRNPCLHCILKKGLIWYSLTWKILIHFFGRIKGLQRNASPINGENIAIISSLKFNIVIITRIKTVCHGVVISLQIIIHNMEFIEMQCTWITPKRTKFWSEGFFHLFDSQRIQRPIRDLYDCRKNLVDEKCISKYQVHWIGQCSILGWP